MIYFIKFLYSFVLPPGLFVVLLLGLTVWLWRRNRRPALTLLGVTFLLYLSMTPLVGDLLIGGLERQYDKPELLQGDVIVVLGGGASSGNPDIDGEGNMYGPAANRLLTAVRLHRQTGLPVLFSGGRVFADSGNEADIAKRQLMGLGVPESDILAENRSLNTEQNAVNTAALMKSHGLSHPILVTSAFHMPRAMIRFKDSGLAPLAYPTDFIASREILLYPAKFTPSPGAVNTAGTALKEYLGLLAARF
ncbi:YdcF family protein [Paenibacillus sp. S150]|uniref:YdcF family protein n=1 Tax=Paenibacillus sp. S150 TaxID=2749826 RepID=UPI001C56CEAC|nr:YdcF family protein [Paenibacillus sp. S150]MBW4080307.1 YdcF family protein [Paenibacillus sp. S150]